MSLGSTTSWTLTESIYHIYRFWKKGNLQGKVLEEDMIYASFACVVCKTAHQWLHGLVNSPPKRLRDETMACHQGQHIW